MEPPPSSSGSTAPEDDQEEGEITAPDEEPEEQPAAEEKLYVAVPLIKTAWHWRSNLRWAAEHARRARPPRRLVLVYVHRVSMTVNMMGASVHVRKLQESVVAQHRLEEVEKIHGLLDEYLFICKGYKVNAEKLVIESSDIVTGLVELVVQHGVTELVMGAAGDRRYSKSMKRARSKKAIAVQQKADPACRLFFVCKGNLVHTREPGAVSAITTLPGSISGASSSSSGASSPRTSVALTVRSKSLQEEKLLLELQESLPPRSKSLNLGRPSPLPGTTMDLSFQPSDASAGPRRRLRVDSQAFAAEIADADAAQQNASLPALHEEETEDESLFPDISSDDGASCRDLEDKLKLAIMEAENLKRVAYEESRRRHKAERDLADATAKARDAEITRTKEVKSRKEMEERIAKEAAEIERDDQQLRHIASQIKEADERGAALEEQIRKSELMVTTFEGKLSDAYLVLETLRRDGLGIPRAGKSLKQRTPTGGGSGSFTKFTLPELDAATNGFDRSLKIGASDCGEVFRGTLQKHKAPVAIKVLNPDVVAGDDDEDGGLDAFCDQIEALSEARHPNLVGVIGACEAARAVVSELVPNGSLENRLNRRNKEKLPLSWQARSAIAMKIVSALEYLHSRSPEPLVHGGLKPTNVLLDPKCSCKLSDFGIRRLLDQSNANAVVMIRRARDALAYVDPACLATGEATPEGDIYSFGVILLRLLTSKPAFRVRKVTQEALGRGALYEELDSSAGEWPLEHALEMARLGLACCDLRRDCRPGLAVVRRVLEPVVSAAASAAPSRWSFDSSAEAGSSSVPSYFLCPILNEIMKDPQTAADGFTYEAEAIKKWFDGGNDTSPMTNLKLASAELLPNHSLRCAIQDWVQQRENAGGFGSPDA